MPELEQEINDDKRCCTLCECVREFWRTPIGRHLVNARKELLLAARTCIDRRIERLEKLLEEDEGAREVPIE